MPQPTGVLDRGQRLLPPRSDSNSTGWHDGFPTRSWCTHRCTHRGSTRSRVYFSVLQRKVLSPNDFTDLAEVKQRLTSFEQRYNATATPFRWKFTRNDLHELLTRISHHEQQQQALPDLPHAA